MFWWLVGISIGAGELDRKTFEREFDNLERFFS